MRVQYWLMLMVPMALSCGGDEDKKQPKDKDTASESDADADTGTDTDTGEPTASIDDDGDGFTPAEGDCDDTDSDINPDAADAGGDGIDSNCDGVDGVDSDGDGHASVASGGDDCDDTEATTAPSARDIPGDGIDNNCNGVTDGILASEMVHTIIEGDSEISYFFFGADIASPGDIDGDGLDDIWIGAPQNNSLSTYKGAALHFSGAVLSEGGTIGAYAAATTVLEGDRYDRAGRFIHAPGDFDGDGRAELLVGTHPAGFTSARVYLVWGDRLEALGSSSLATAGQHLVGGGQVVPITGPAGKELLMPDCGSPDGHFCVLPLADVPEVAEVVMSDVSGIWMRSETYFSDWVTGDVDGDGLTDLVVGSPYEALVDDPETPSLRVFLGASRPTDGSILSIDDADIEIYADLGGDALGDYSSFDLGDIDGDGRDDLVAGAKDSSTDLSGVAYVFLADTLVAGSMEATEADVIMDTAVPGADAISMVQFVSDIDGDGLEDLAITGALAPDDTALGVRIYLGAGMLDSPTRDLLNPDLQWSPEPMTYSGALTVHAAGDLNGDGRGDLAIGNTYGAGQAFILLDLVP